MSDSFFVDTNILAYLFDKNEPEKRIISKDIISGLFSMSGYFISTQVIGEFCNIAEKKLTPAMPSEKIESFVSTFPSESIITISRNDIVSALHLRETYRYSFWDSLILASALNASCAVLYTEDMQNGQIIENALKIVNPYLSGY